MSEETWVLSGWKYMVSMLLLVIVLSPLAVYWVSLIKKDLQDFIFGIEDSKKAQ